MAFKVLMANYIILSDSLIASAAVGLLLTDLIVRAKQKPVAATWEFESSLRIYLDAENREKRNSMK